MSNQQEHDPGIPTAADMLEYFYANCQVDYHTAASNYQYFKKTKLSGPHCGIAARL